jgi:hypothetical protein
MAIAYRFVNTQQQEGTNRKHIDLCSMKRRQHLALVGYSLAKILSYFVGSVAHLYSC